MKKKYTTPKQKEIRPKILKLSEKQCNLMMQEMPRGYKLSKYEDWRNLELEYHRDLKVHSFLYPGSFQIHQSSLSLCIKEIQRYQKLRSKNPHKLLRQPLLDDTFENKIISKKQLNAIILRIKKDKAVTSIKNKFLKEIFTKEIQKLLSYYKIKNIFDLKCYLLSGFDTFFFNSDELDAINHKMKVLQHEILDQLKKFKEQIEEKPIKIIQIDEQKSFSNSKNKSQDKEKAIIDFSNAKFSPNIITLARKINLGRNLQNLTSQQLSNLCQKYFFLKQQGVDSYQSEYEIRLQSLSLRQFLQIEKEVKQYLKQRKKQFEIIQQEKNDRFVIQNDD